MSKSMYKKTIEHEIEKLNQKIDLKIIKGLSYRTEAKRHKFLLARLSELSQYSFPTHFGLFQKMGHVASSFFL